MAKWAYCIVACFHFLVTLETVDCFAIGTKNDRRPLTGVSRPTARSRPFTGLYERKEDDVGGDEDDRPAFVNDLDIFGQPKDRKRPAVEDESEINGPDRIKSCIPYALPLIDGDSFGHYIYERFPPLGDLDYVLFRPIVDACNAAPVLILLLFVLFSLGPHLTGQSREVRFNAQQAVLLDVALIFPNLIGEAVAEADADLPRAIMEPCSNFVWYALATALVYCVTSNLRGKVPNQIPFFSDVAEFAIGPY